jgi:hypothetical protein
MDVGEIASAAAGDQNFFAKAVCTFENGDALTAISGFDRAHQACRATAEDKCVKLASHGAVTCRTG